MANLLIWEWESVCSSSSSCCVLVSLFFFSMNCCRKDMVLDPVFPCSSLPTSARQLCGKPSPPQQSTPVKAPSSREQSSLCSICSPPGLTKLGVSVKLSTDRTC